MDHRHVETFKAYGGAVDQRWGGALNAGNLGAVGVIVRSMTLTIDEHPHTGSMAYADSVKKIPACAISTLHANQLSDALKSNPKTKFFLKMNCQTFPDVLSYNVIGEIKGTESPERFIIVGGHLDAWDNGDGAHDDGAGCVQSIEVLRIFKALNHKPKNTIRAVMFMNEENGLRGGLKYAGLAKERNEYHIAAIETDAGGFSPRGFSFKAEKYFLHHVKKFKPLLLPYGLYDFEREGGGADIGPLHREMKTPMIGLLPDSQRYFDIHHTSEDTFDKINKRELELGAGAMAALIYLLDKYEIK
jgi:carboxypeptidase Q